MKKLKPKTLITCANVNCLAIVPRKWAISVLKDREELWFCPQCMLSGLNAENEALAEEINGLKKENYLLSQKLKENGIKC